MNVSDLMTAAVKACAASDNLQRAAQIMWENDCGSVPVVESDGRVIGMLTDRDICMAAYTQGQPLWQIPIANAMTKEAYTVRQNDSLEAAEALMRRAQVRRVPVLDGDGRLTGIVSMNDLVRHAHQSRGRTDNGLSGDSIAHTLAAICEPRLATSVKPATANGER